MVHAGPHGGSTGEITLPNAPSWSIMESRNVPSTSLPKREVAHNPGYTLLLDDTLYPMAMVPLASAARFGSPILFHEPHCAISRGSPSNWMSASSISNGWPDKANVPRNARALLGAKTLGGSIKPLSEGEIAARNAGYKPYSPETWRAWEYWARRAGCAAMVTRPDSKPARAKKKL